MWTRRWAGWRLLPSLPRPPLRHAPPQPPALHGAPHGHGPHETDRSHRARLLVVDDNADMRAYLTQLLQPDYDVLLAPDGRDALEMALAQPVELVLSDVMMPDMDAMWSIDPAYGVQYRDPKDVQQQALDLEFEPNTDPLRRMRSSSSAGPVGGWLQQYTLLETVYRPAQVISLIEKMRDDKVVATEPRRSPRRPGCSPTPRSLDNASSLPPRPRPAAPCAR
ncbi:hypothetical protein ABIE67_001254 [Streptomyces sp. V4I8]|uniref:response regulator n=1 Tax=Streptomyces sp. V4I8 TaxID=3156469 RepID=UPI003513E792